MREEYDLQLHAAYLRMCRAVAQLARVRATARDDGPVDRELGGTATYVEAELDWAEQQLADLAEPADDGSVRPMQRLIERLGWTADEVDFVWAVVALAANPRIVVQARALDDGAVRGLSLALYSQLANLPADVARELGLALATGHSAVAHGLIVPAPGAFVAAAVPWAPAPELVQYLAGIEVRSRWLAEVIAPLTPILDDAQQHAVIQLAAIIGDPDPVVLYLEGPAFTGRRTAVALAARGPALVLDVRQAGGSTDELAEALTALARGTVLGGAVPVLVGVEALPAGDPRRAIVARQIAAMSRPVVIASTRPGLDIGARLPIERVRWPLPDVAARGQLWHAAVEARRQDDSDDDGDDDGEGGSDAIGVTALAHGFRLGAGGIQRAVVCALAAKPPAEPLSSSVLLAGVRASLAERLAGLAERIPVPGSLEDAVLPEHLLAQVRSLVHAAERAESEHEGVVAVFSGPPGTGKTLVAGSIAHALDAELYRVDLAQIAAAGPGQAETRLAEVFAVAGAGHIVLVVDHIGALAAIPAGDRAGLVTELVSRLAAFPGVVILTLGCEERTGDTWGALAQALAHRVTGHLVFAPPGDDDRARLWRRRLHAQGMALDGAIDVHSLARQFPRMVGADIDRAARGARFLAIGAGHARIELAMVMAAARNEALATRESS